MPARYLLKLRPKRQPVKKTMIRLRPKRTVISRRRLPKNARLGFRPFGGNSGPLPFRFYTKFKYFERFNLNNSGVPSLLASLRLNLNSIHDPNSSGTGSRPRGWTELNSIYKRYRIMGCRVKLTPMVTSTSAFGGRMLFGWQPLSSTTAQVANQTDAREALGCKCWVVNNNEATKSYSKYFDCASVAGMAKQAYRGEVDTSADFAADPVQLSRLHVFIGSPDDTTAVSGVISVEMTFYAVLFERKLLADA